MLLRSIVFTLIFSVQFGFGISDELDQEFQNQEKKATISVKLQVTRNFGDNINGCIVQVVLRDPKNAKIINEYQVKSSDGAVLVKKGPGNYQSVDQGDKKVTCEYKHRYEPLKITIFDKIKIEARCCYDQGGACLTLYDNDKSKNIIALESDFVQTVGDLKCKLIAKSNKIFINHANLVGDIQVFSDCSYNFGRLASRQDKYRSIDLENAIIFFDLNFKKNYNNYESNSKTGLISHLPKGFHNFGIIDVDCLKTIDLPIFLDGYDTVKIGSIEQQNKHKIIRCGRDISPVLKKWDTLRESMLLNLYALNGKLKNPDDSKEQIDRSLKCKINKITGTDILSIDAVNKELIKRDPNKHSLSAAYKSNNYSIDVNIGNIPGNIFIPEEGWQCTDSEKGILDDEILSRLLNQIIFSKFINPNEYQQSILENLHFGDNVHQFLVNYFTLLIESEEYPEQLSSASNEVITDLYFMNGDKRHDLGKLRLMYIPFLSGGILYYNSAGVRIDEYHLEEIIRKIITKKYIGSQLDQLAKNVCDNINGRRTAKLNQGIVTNRMMKY